MKTVELNESKEKQQLNRKIDLLGQENNVLLSHLENLK